MNSDYSNRFCLKPWTYAEVHPDGEIWHCCPAWIKEPMGNLLYQSWDEIWNGEVARNIRQLMFGSFDCCIAEECPYLLDKKVGPYGPVYDKDDMDRLWDAWDPVKPLKNQYENKETYDPVGPTAVNLLYDESCNLQCPTCRYELIMRTPNAVGYERVEKIHKIVMEKVLKDAVQIIIAGSGDAFASALYRDFMRTFNSKDYPKVEYIHPMTNALLWNKKMWDSMKRVHPYVKSCYISVDAVTSETYNKVRTTKSQYGNFDQLIENLKFINTIPNITEITLAYVISHLNYFEVDKFIPFMKKYFPNKTVTFVFYKINDYTDGIFPKGETFKDYAVHFEDHPKHQDFLKYWKRCLKWGEDGNQRIVHTLQGIG